MRTHFSLGEHGYDNDDPRDARVVRRARTRVQERPSRARNSTTSTSIRCSRICSRSGPLRTMATMRRFPRMLSAGSVNTVATQADFASRSTTLAIARGDALFVAMPEIARRPSRRRRSTVRIRFALPANTHVSSTAPRRGRPAAAPRHRAPRYPRANLRSDAPTATPAACAPPASAIETVFRRYRGDARDALMLRRRVARR